MALALFDLDETLIAGDSDYEWGCHLVSIGKVDGEAYAQKNERFYKEYLAGELDIYEFLNFSFKPLAENSYEELCQWRNEYVHSRIKPIIKAKANELIEKHRSAGDHLALITATNRFITEPIKDLLNFETLIATEPEISNGNFTGNVQGMPCFGPGKVIRIKQWMKTTAYTLKGSYFYTDSHNDIPLLELVGHPTAVDADAALTAHAIKNNWSRLSLK